jgi:hypothetical protein
VIFAQAARLGLTFPANLAPLVIDSVAPATLETHPQLCPGPPSMD